MLDGSFWFLRILWVCRVSVLSAVAGVALFYAAVPAQNLLADLSFDGSGFLAVLFWSSFFLFVFLFWAFPVHYGARHTLDDDAWILTRAEEHVLPEDVRRTVVRTLRRRYSFALTWVPRVLGLVPFIALAIGIYYGAKADEGASALDEGPLTIKQADWLYVGDAIAAAVYLIVVLARKAVMRAMDERLLDHLATVAMGLAIAFLLLAYFAPIWVSAWCPRAMLIPPLFGSLVLILSWLQRWTHKTGIPFIFLLFVGAVGISAANAHFHDLRTLPRAAGGPGRLTIAAAVDAWKAANGCADAAPCGRHPLVVAIDGGASRAAFTAATFVGEVLDRMPVAADEAASPGRRLFAISGVSGGAFGAAVIQAALADAQATSRPATAPCQGADRTWFGYRYRERTNRSFSWRECLQALTSGDYLSPTIVGLAFRDLFAPRPGFDVIEDRAVLLEQSWERHYDWTIAGRSPFSTGEVCAASATGGLCRRFAHVAEAIDKTRKTWMPLMLLNSTSVSTGRRVVASDLKSAPVDGDVGGSLYPEAYDLGEAMSSGCPVKPKDTETGTRYVSDVLDDASADKQTVRTRDHGTCGAPGQLDGPDIRLSTAALTSARFPLISPAGAFAMPASRFGDSVVDGGYFENSGLTTALDIVAALRDAGLQPDLLSIGNDPEASHLDTGLPRRPASTPMVARSADGFLARAFAFIKTPFDALVATRDGHAAEAEQHAEDAFAGADDVNAGRYYRMRVEQNPDLAPGPKADAQDKATCGVIWERQTKTPLSMAKVSMSWWLSASVQADLDAQKCSIANRAVLAAVMTDLSAR